MSSAVSTACTPAIANASPMSMARIRACTCGLRSVTPQSMSSIQRRWWPESQRGHRVSDVGMWKGAEWPEGDVGEFALLQRADLVLPSEHCSPAYRCHFQRVSDCHRSRSAPSTREEQGVADLVD